MAKDLKTTGQEVHVAEVVHHGEKLLIPEQMTIDQALILLARRKEYLQQEVALHQTYPVFPWDGANAVNEVLCERYGWAEGASTPSFFGEDPPHLINVEIAPGVFKMVPWGRLRIPGVEGSIQLGVAWDGHQLLFQITAKVKRAAEAEIRMLFESVKQYLAENSIYRGKAVKVRFLDDDGDRMDMPKIELVDVSSYSEDMLIFSDELAASISTNLFTPIERVNDLSRNNVPVKRGVLLAGTYGTGKTLAASVAAHKAIANNITYIYVPRADELRYAVEFAKQYQNPASVVYCEDVDRVVSGDDRTVEIDDILNVIDGIDTKASNILVVLTTNDLESINPAMLRPGRLDAVIKVTTPDAKAVEKLLRAYGGNMIRPDANLTQIAHTLDGLIPATIAEVVKRAKLSQIRMSPPGTVVQGITEEALMEAAKSMRSQIDLLESKLKPQQPTPTVDSTLTKLIKSAVNPVAVED